MPYDGSHEKYHGRGQDPDPHGSAVQNMVILDGLAPETLLVATMLWAAWYFMARDFGSPVLYGFCLIFAIPFTLFALLGWYLRITLWFDHKKAGSAQTPSS